LNGDGTVFPRHTREAAGVWRRFRSRRGEHCTARIDDLKHSEAASERGKRI
jgi:hypothetical protein